MSNFKTRGAKAPSFRPPWSQAINKACSSHQILPFIDGFRHVQKVALMADVDPELARICVQNLAFYKFVRLISVFMYSNVYVATPKINRWEKLCSFHRFWVLTSQPKERRGGRFHADRSRVWGDGGGNNWGRFLIIYAPFDVITSWCNYLRRTKSRALECCAEVSPPFDAMTRSAELFKPPEFVTQQDSTRVSAEVWTFSTWNMKRPFAYSCPWTQRGV